jgi:putative colanic acid biosynthesis acetyltransferase WcaF
VVQVVSKVRNDLFDKTLGLDRGRPRWIELLWYICKVTFFLSALPWPSSLKRSILLAFGAEIGQGFVIRPRVNIHFPWKLRIGDHCWVGERTEILNLEEVILRDHVALAHDVYLAAAGHDISSPTLAYQNRRIVVKEGTWIASRVFVNPGVTIGAGAVVVAGTVVTKDVPDDCIVGGNPAKEIRRRQIKDE